MTDLTPQPGDVWTLRGKPVIEVVAVKQGDAYYAYDGRPMRDPVARFTELARRSIERGAVLRRGGEVVSKELEDFEV